MTQRTKIENLPVPEKELIDEEARQVVGGLSTLFPPIGGVYHTMSDMDDPAFILNPSYHL